MKFLWLCLFSFLILVQVAIFFAAILLVIRFFMYPSVIGGFILFALLPIPIETALTMINANIWEKTL